MTNNTTPTTLDNYVLSRLLESSGITTYDFYQEGVITPANAVCRLRKKGHDIVTTRVTVVDDHGIFHKRVAKYSLDVASEQGGTADE